MIGRVRVLSERSGRFIDFAPCALAAASWIYALILVASLLYGRAGIAGPQRRAWWVLLAFIAVNFLASDVWIYLPSGRQRAFLSYEDGPFLLDYWLLTAAFALLFVSVGGSLRRPLVWLDVATMIVVQLVGFWVLLVAPQIPTGIDQHVSVPLMAAYSITVAALTSMAAVLWMQTRGMPGQAPILLLIGAVWCEVAWEVVWLASWLSNDDFAGSYYNFGDLLCSCCIGSAAVLTQRRGAQTLGVPSPERSVESFLPALAVLLAIPMVAGSVAATRRSEAGILVGLVLICAALVLTRQRSVRRGLQAMRAALAQREADARLTELVRRSADVIVVVGVEGAIGFASPASESMLSVAPSRLQGAPGAALLGPARVPQLSMFLEELKRGPITPSAIELRHVRGARGERTIKLSGSNQLANPHINGMVLTLTDVTEQRALEREVLEVATRERARLCGDIHDGLGQELVGIAMLLQGVATLPDPDPAVHKSQLKNIIGHVNRSIQIARDLARGLSPLHVVRGSLASALRRLADEHSSRKPVHLWVDGELGEGDLDDVSADHLYRIAHEAVNNAISHAKCTRVEIALTLGAAGITLRVADDGIGFDHRSADFSGLGLKLMEYRARLLGGTFRIERLSNAGTHIIITLPARAGGDGGRSVPQDRDGRPEDAMIGVHRDQ